MDLVLIDDLRQSHLEDFDEAYWKLKDASPSGGKGKNTDNGMIVRAAMSAGWFGPDYLLDVDKRVRSMRPAEVIQVATAVNAKYKVITTVDPLLLWRLVDSYLTMDHARPTSPELLRSDDGETLAAVVG